MDLKTDILIALALAHNAHNGQEAHIKLNCSQAASSQRRCLVVSTTQTHSGHANGRHIHLAIYGTSEKLASIIWHSPDILRYTYIHSIHMHAWYKVYTYVHRTYIPTRSGCIIWLRNYTIRHLRCAMCRHHRPWQHAGKQYLRKHVSRIQHTSRHKHIHSQPHTHCSAGHICLCHIR